MVELKGREAQIINERIRKIEELRKQGFEPYPHNYEKKNSVKDCLNSKIGSEVKTAGRIMTQRDLGKIAFVKLRDFSGEIQIVLQQGETPEKTKDFFKKYIDAGDFIGVEGKIIKTKTGETSILVREITILTKTIKPLPEKYHGLQDKEERYRKRYLDLIMNPEVKEVFLKREKILNSIRKTLKEKGFTEVDTPYLQSIYGGAEARPFKTHLNSLDIDMYLAISPELHLKRLIVGNFDKVFTIARNFRNEGIDKSHNPEFTMMEIYQAYSDYNDMMKLTEEIFENACIIANGTNKVKRGDVTLDFKRPWKRMTMVDAIKEFAKIDVLNLNEKDLKKICDKEEIEAKGKTWGYYVSAIFEHFCEEKLIQPTFIIDHPKESTPLCKKLRGDVTNRFIERFEPFCMGMEIANAYTELNDPVEQRRLLEEQQEKLSKGDDEANPYDDDFVNAIEVGMPPTGGLGIGIDRMVILLTGQESIRDVILFPFMKPEGLKKGEKKKGK